MSPLVISLLAATAFGGTERFAVIAGSNDGGPERATLRYADTDAADVAEVLGTLGGLSDEGTQLLLDADPSALDEALARVREQVTQARARGSRTEVIFYYSGHSDESGLLPEGELYPYPQLRQNLTDVGADVQLVVLDSCASGAMFRTKGGTVTAPFLVDDSADIKGHAYLTSSSENEVAQESDRIEASYFTHYLTSGLRGAADSSGDGQVTLMEVYQFAKDETLARTERSLAGPQHPSYEFQLAGTGDLVVTSIDAQVATLYVPEGITGRLFVRDAGGDLVAELSKPAERGVVLGMSPGEHTVLLVDGDNRAEASFTAVSGQTITLSNLDFRAVEGEVVRVRGDAPASGDVAYERVGMSLMVVPTRTTFDGPRTEVGIGVGLIAHHADRLSGAQVSFGANIASETVEGGQVALGANYAGDEVRGIQAAVGANLADGDVDGTQWSVGFNGANGSVRGIQATVGGNVANGDVEGVQGAVGVNIATGGIKGAQLAAGVNLAKKSEGIQGSAGVNVSEHHKGLQLGIVNVGGKVDGLQLGLVNIAEDADESIALVPINAAGYNHVVVTSNESDHLDLGVSYGGKRLYTSVRYGFRVQADGADRHSALLGLGLHAGDRLFVDTDVAAGNWFVGNRWQNALLVRGRMGLGLEIIDGVAIIGGPTLSTIPWREQGTEAYRATGFEGNVVRPNRWGWVGLFAGIRLL